MRKAFIAVLIFLLSCGASWAAIDCDKTTLETAIADAADGATITCNGGSIAYTEATSIDLTQDGGKGVTIVGTGLTITGDVTKFSVTGVDGKAWRITGFTLTGDSHDAINVFGASKNFRIDGNTFNTAAGGSHRSINIVGYTYGVIDNNTVNLSSNDVYTLVSVRETVSDGGSGSWQRASSFGTANAVYIENNTLTLTEAGSAGPRLLDIDAGGGRAVVRYNTCTNCGGWTSHDAVTNDLRGARHVEIYNNAINLTNKTTGRTGPTWRGGTGLIYNNAITGGTYLAFPTRFMLLNNYRSYDGGQVGSVWEQACDGTEFGMTPSASDTCTPINGTTCIKVDQTDGGTDESGWPCRDQIGRGVDSGSTQASEPMYFWNNTIDGTYRAPTISSSGLEATHIQSGRDFFDAATYAELSQKPTGYTAYECPHPLVDPTNTKTCNTTAGTSGYGITVGNINGATISGATIQ